MPATDYSALREEITAGKTETVSDSGGAGSEKPEFKAAVGLSRQWDARKAGREVAYKTLEKLGTKPDFFLLFSTIHYEKYGGFKEFLAGVWEILPKGTPLIGGTVAGFINPEGCFTRGATAMAVSYPNMDVAVGVGRNTKRAPHIAAKECAGMIKKGLENSKYENKFLFEVVSGGKIPQFPGLGRRRVIKSGIIGKLATTLSHISLIVLQKGVGREEEVLESLVGQLPDYTIIGGSAIDCNNMVENFQFFGRYVYSNSLVALGLKTNLDIKVNTTYGLKDTNIKMNITKKSGNDRVIHRIDNAPALDSFLKKITWPDDFIDERLYRKTFFIPL
ncbi:MAG: hypothetical protein L6243_04240, partial [Candidatus Altiarchaeales archaeon]|nr:hypothetical protein [Candidatus Altiarchaeales archaeon]